MSAIRVVEYHVVIEELKDHPCADFKVTVKSKAGNYVSENASNVTELGGAFARAVQRLCLLEASR